MALQKVGQLKKITKFHFRFRDRRQKSKSKVWYVQIAFCIFTICVLSSTDVCRHIHVGLFCMLKTFYV